MLPQIGENTVDTTTSSSYGPPRTAGAQRPWSGRISIICQKGKSVLLSFCFPRRNPVI